MKYAVITPTFKPHFKFIKKYLKSYNKFVVDKENVTLLFTISKNEAKAFKKITDKYCDGIKYETLFFEDILNHFGINLTPDELLKKYKKFTFQTLKKFYTMLYSDADRFLVLDSESMWIKKTNMKNLFENFFKNPFISGSSISNRKSITKFTQGVINNTNYLLNKNTDKWFLENFVWFYDKEILNDLFNKYGSPIQMAEAIYNLQDKQKLYSGIFEIELYQAYLYHNLETYTYKFFNVDKLLEKFLPSNTLNQYLEDCKTLFINTCGLIEHSCLLLNDENYKNLADIFKKSNFNIIRCDYSSLENILLQEKFMNILQPNILAASQSHAFGINNKYKTLINYNKYSTKVKKHFFNLIHPKKMSFQLLIEPFSIIFYGIKFLRQRKNNIKKYKELYNNEK